MRHASATGDPEQTIDGDAPRAEPAPRATIAATPALDYAELSMVERRHYAIVGEIAKGGMGRVLEARDLRLGRAVAIKELLPKNRDVARRFEREARITARLQHPAIIHVYEAGVWPGGEPFYAMPLVSGRSLDKVVAERATLVDRLGLVPTVLAVADALAYAHSENVIHRDLKPTNVLVGEFGQTVVIDWGLAKDLGAPPVDPKESLNAQLRAADETLSGGVVGTPAYMPPEQARGEPVDQRADVYAIGALLYKVLSGHAPYSGDSSRRVLDAVKAAPPVPLDEREPGTPPDLATIVAKAMARAPADRYANAGELAKDLARFQTGQLVAAHRYTRRQLTWRFLRRYRLPFAVGAIALAALALVAGFGVRGILDEKARTEAKRLALLEERGRSELLAERAGPALAYLVHAAPEPDPGPARAFLLAEAMRPFQAELATLDAGHGQVTLAVSADGRTLATGSDEIAVWDLATGARRLFEPGFARIRALAFDSDGTHLAAGGDDGVAWIWTLARGGHPLELRGHGGPIRDIEFSPDRTRVVTASDDGTARVWDVATGAVVATSRWHTAGVLVARFSPDGSMIASASEDGSAWVWWAEEGTSLSPLRGHTAPVRAVQWSRDNDRVLTASDDGTALLFDPELGKPIARSFKHKKAVVSAELSPDGEHVLTASADHTAIVWDLPEAEDGGLIAPAVAAELPGTDELVAATFDASGARVATAGIDGVATVWDAAKGQALASFEHGSSVHAIAFAGDGKLVTGDVAGHAHVWDLRRGLAGDPDDLESRVHAVAAAGEWVAAGTDDRRVTLWHAGRKLEPLREHVARVLAVALDGTTLVSGGEDPQAIVWDLASGRPTPRCRLAPHRDERTNALAASAGVVARVVPDAVEVWATDDCRLLAVRDDGAAELGAVALRRDAGQLAAGGEDGRVLVIDTVRGVWLPAAPRSLAALAGPVGALAYSPDGRRLLVGGDGVAKIIDVATGREIETLDGPFGNVTAVAWLDDERVVTANAEGLAQIWDANKGKLLGVRGARGAAVRGLAIAGDALWLGSDAGDVRTWDVHVSREPAADRAALAARTGWILGDDDVVRRKAED